MRKSIAGEYFSLSMALIAASMIIISALLLEFSAYIFKDDRKQMLERSSSELRSSSHLYLENGFDAAAPELASLYSSQAYRTGMDFILFDSNGDVLVCSETSPCSHMEKRLSMDLVRSASSDGIFSLDSLNGFFQYPCLNILYRIDSADVVYFFSASMSAEGYNNFLMRSITMFAVVFIVIMAVVYPLLKYNINRILGPLKEMTLAAKKFGEGDFSHKVMITDRNEMGFLANTLNDMASSLEAIEENRKSFISNVSHELRTPMTTIGGFVDGILDGTIDKSQHREYLKTVSEEINRLARLVRSMLNISKYEAGEMRLQTEDFNITELTVKTVLLFEKRIEEKNIEIRGLDADKFFVNADMDLIQQVIYNLTENAVKFVNAGGYISYGFRTEDGMVTVVIRNSGDGLKKSEIGKVFDRFYKTDESRGRDKTGVGLGLSIVRSIIKLHDGWIQVRSKTGEYTEFEFAVSARNPE
ncbi:MAG: HAMP domain-containing histidine kinase [Ruminococcus sp.]|nr:HAMP domain-containing histidine kinase [Ruminococcus sp.]